MNRLEAVMFEQMKKLFREDGYKVEIEQSIDEILHAFFQNIGEIEASFMTEVNFISAYKDKDVEAMQIFSTLSADIREELFPSIEERLNELNSLCVFGAFALFRDGKQIFHKYVVPVSDENMEITVKNLQTVWKEIFSTICYLLPYILIISNEKDFISLNEYMEVLNEAY